MIRFWTEYFQEHGKPSAIYIDCHATYKVNHPQDRFDDEMKTRFRIAVEQLDIEVIYSKSPQGKGRIERSFRTHQDRLIKKMRIAGIRDYKEAERYINEVYLPGHNRKFAVVAKDKGDFHIPITKEEQNNIEWYFAERAERVLKRDGTISFKKKKYQIERKQIVKNKYITVQESTKGNIRLYSGNVLLSFYQLLLF